MVDFTKDKTWAATQVIENNADTQLTPTLGNALIHAGNISDVVFGGNIDLTPTVGRVRLSPSDGGDSEIAHETFVTTAFTQVRLINPNGQVGSISTSGTVTSYNTSSDPRLKDFKDLPVDSDIDSEFNKLFSCFRTFNWKNDPAGDLVWGFDAHDCIDAKLDMGSEGEGPRDLFFGDVYDITPAVFEEQEQQVVYKSGDKKGELRFNVDESPMMETVSVEVTPEIEHKVTPAGVDQSKAVPILLAKIEQLERRLVAAGL